MILFWVPYDASEATPRNPSVHIKHNRFLTPKAQFSLVLTFKLCVRSLISAIHCRYLSCHLSLLSLAWKKSHQHCKGEGRVPGRDRKAPCAMKAPHKPERGRRHPGSCWGRRRSPSWGARAQPAQCCSPPRQRAWGHCCGRSQTCRRSRRKRACNLRRQTEQGLCEYLVLSQWQASKGNWHESSGQGWALECAGAHRVKKTGCCLPSGLWWVHGKIKILSYSIPTSKEILQGLRVLPSVSERFLVSILVGGRAGIHCYEIE